MAVKLRKPIEIPAPNGDPPAPMPLRPLPIQAICITRAALVEAMRVYIPGLRDIEVVEDGERFLLTLAEANGASEARRGEDDGDNPHD